MKEKKIDQLLRQKKNISNETFQVILKHCAYVQQYEQ